MAANRNDVSHNQHNENQSAQEQSLSPRDKCSHMTVELKIIFILTLGIFLEMTAFETIETLQSSVNSVAGLGPLSLACLYGPYFSFAIFAPAIVRIITPKWCLVTAWTCEALYMGANFYPTWLTLIPSAAMVGAMTGPMWTSKDLYVSQMARQTVKRNPEAYKGKHQSVLSFYNGIVFAGLSLCMVVGQIISSSILIQSSSAKHPSVCGAFSCQDDVFPVVNVTNQTHIVSTHPDKLLVYALLAVLLSLMLLAIFLIIVFLQPIPLGNQNNSIKWAVLSCARHTTDSKMMLMMPQFLLFGFYQAIMMGDYTKSYITCAAGVGMVGYVAMCWGVTSTLASVVCGYLAKYIERPIQVVFALLGYIGLTSMLWVWIPTPDEITWLFVAAGVFGIIDVVLHTNVCTLLALMFKDESAGAFANWYTFRSMAKAVSFGLSPFVCVWVELSIASVLLTLACVTFVILEVKLKCRQPSLKVGYSELD